MGRKIGYQRRTVTKLAMICLAIFLVCASVNGQQPERLSLNAATNFAIANSPRIRQISWQIEKSISDGFQKSRLVNPQVGTMANEIGNEGEAGQYGFFLQRNIVRNQRVSQIQNAYQWEARSLESSHQLIQRRIAFEVAKLFIDVSYLEKQLALYFKKKKELENFAQVIAKFAAGGESSPLELKVLEVEQKTIEQQVKVAEIELANKKQLLQTFLGESVESEIELKLDFDFQDEIDLILQSSFKRDASLDDHPAIQQISNQIEAHRWHYQVATSRQRPDWQIQTNVNYDFASEDFFGGFTFNVPWQLNDNKQGLIGSAAAQIQILNESRERMRLLLERKLIELSGQRLAKVSQIESIANEILPAVDSIAEQKTKLFHAGELGIKDVKDAIMESFRWREKKLILGRDLLLVEAETETLPME